MKKNDLISRSAAIRELGGFDDDGRIRDILCDLPTIDPEELRPVGHWYDKGSLSCRCSRCGCKNDRESHYCPICGARMEG